MAEPTMSPTYVMFRAHLVTDVDAERCMKQDKGILFRLPVGDDCQPTNVTENEDDVVVTLNGDKPTMTPTYSMFRAHLASDVNAEACADQEKGILFLLAGGMVYVATKIEEVGANVVVTLEYDQ